jgi:hypothetical protein
MKKTIISNVNVRTVALGSEMSIAADDQSLPCRDGLKKKLPRRCPDGIQKNVLISKAVTGLN